MYLEDGSPFLFGSWWWGENLNLRQNQVVMPTFDAVLNTNISLASLCTTPILLSSDETVACYCNHVTNNTGPVDLNQLMQLMRLAVGGFSREPDTLNYELPPDFSTRSKIASRQSSFPYCFYGNETESLVFGVPDMEEVDFANARNEADYRIKMKVKIQI